MLTKTESPTTKAKTNEWRSVEHYTEKDIKLFQNLQNEL